MIRGMRQLRLACLCLVGAVTLAIGCSSDSGSSSSSDSLGDASTPPPGCGNGTVESTEECDGQNLNGSSCAAATMYAHPNGILMCSSTCKFDTTNCSGTGPGPGPGAGGSTGGPTGTGGA